MKPNEFSEYIHIASRKGSVLTISDENLAKQNNKDGYKVLFNFTLYQSLILSRKICR